MKRFMRGVAVGTMVAIASIGVFGCSQVVGEEGVARIGIEQSAENTDGASMKDKVVTEKVKNLEMKRI